VFAALTEVYFLPSTVGTFVGVAVFEETAKALVVVAVGARIGARRPRDGMILGATVGAGYAAFESAGYALQTFLDHRSDHPILNIVSTEAQRAVLSPFGHLTWTALLGGAIFAAWQGGLSGTGGGIARKVRCASPERRPAAPPGGVCHAPSRGNRLSGREAPRPLTERVSTCV
jgi:PrsW family intramembrane metalloprotease